MERPLVIAARDAPASGPCPAYCRGSSARKFRGGRPAASCDRQRKPHPGDIDACYDPVGVDVEKLHPALRDLSPGRPAQKAEFGCEFFPNIVEGGSGKFFVEFFQQERDGRPKGVVVIDLEPEEFES